jgi:hypothetical protein
VQTGVLAAAPAGTAGGVTGPGAFLGPNGAPVSLADYWIAPASSLYTDYPASATTNSIVSAPLLTGQPSAVGAPLTEDRTVAATVKALMAVSGAALAAGEPSAAAAVMLLPEKLLLSGNAEDVLAGQGSVVAVGSGVYLLDATTFTAAGAGSVLGSGASLGGMTGGLLAAQLLGGGSGGPSSSSASGFAKNAARWAAALQVTVRAESADGSEGADGLSRVLQLSLGRFERETDARLAGQQAVLEVQESRQFRPKRYARRLAVALATAAASAPSAPNTQQVPPRPSVGPGAGLGAGGLPPKFGPGAPSYHGVPTAPVNKFTMGSHGGVAGGQYRPGAPGSSSTGNMLNAALSNKVVSAGQPSCGFSSVAKVVVNLAPTVQTSGSSGNISAMMHRPK